MAYPNPNAPSPPVPSQGLGVPVPPPQGGVSQGGLPPRGMPIQPQGARVPPRGMPQGGGMSTLPPTTRTGAIQKYAETASRNPLEALRMAQLNKTKGASPASSGTQPSSGIGGMAPNMFLAPVKDFKLHKVLEPLAEAAAAALAMNLDPETRQELIEGKESPVQEIESREPPVQEIIEETEDVPIDNSGIGNLANQFLGNNLPQLDSKSYAGMGENELRKAAGGGLMGLAVEDEFSGIVEGEGHGMEDNIRMPIKEEGEEVGTLAVSPKEYVVDSHTMSALGNGNPDEGADIMDEFVENIREEAFGTIEQPNEIDGLASLQSMLERV
tara:strand:+ start:13 stop:993 length:981 start_codon:yes stop_codon:yes gene_type:complete